MPLSFDNPVELLESLPPSKFMYALRRSGKQEVRGNKVDGTEGAHTLSFRLVSFCLAYVTRSKQWPSHEAKVIASRELDTARNLRLTKRVWNVEDDHNDIRIIYALYNKVTLTHLWAANRLAWAYTFASSPQTRSHLLVEVGEALARVRVKVPGMRAEASLRDFMDKHWRRLCNAAKVSMTPAQWRLTEAGIKRWFSYGGYAVQRKADAVQAALAAIAEADRVAALTGSDAAISSNGQSGDGANKRRRRRGGRNRNAAADHYQPPEVSLF